MSKQVDVPRPSVTTSDSTVLGASAGPDTRQRLAVIEDRQRWLLDRLAAVQAERFRRGESTVSVTPAAVCPPADSDPLPAATRQRLSAAATRRWRLATEMVVYAGYPPGYDGGRCSRGDALAAVADEVETVDVRSIEVPASAVQLIAAGQEFESTPPHRIAVRLPDGGQPLELDFETDPAPALADAESIHLTWHSEAGLEVARSLGEAFEDLAAVTVLFETGGPRREYGNPRMGIGDRVPERLLCRLHAVEPLPDPETAELLETTVADSWFTIDEQIEVARLFAGQTDRVCVRYGTGVPAVIVAIARLAGAHVVPIPQCGSALVTRDPVPQAVRAAAAAFPERQQFTDRERTTLQEFLGLPDHAVPVPGPADEHRALETMARLLEAGELSLTDVFHVEVSPWVPSPEPDAVRADTAVGEDIASALARFDRRFGVSLGAHPLNQLHERVHGVGCCGDPTDGSASGDGGSKT